MLTMEATKDEMREQVEYEVERRGILVKDIVGFKKRMAHTKCGTGMYLGIIEKYARVHCVKCGRIAIAPTSMSRLPGQPREWKPATPVDFNLSRQEKKNKKKSPAQATGEVKKSVPPRQTKGEPITGKGKKSATILKHAEDMDGDMARDYDQELDRLAGQLAKILRAHPNPDKLKLVVGTLNQTVALLEGSNGTK